MADYRDVMTENGALQRKRMRQHKIWMWNQIKDKILDLFQADPHVRERIPQLEEQVAQRLITPGLAADILLSDFSKALSGNDGH